MKLTSFIPAVLIFLCGTVLAEEVVFYVSEDGAPVTDIAITVNDNKKLIEKSGFVVFDIDSGNHTVELTRYGQWVGDFSFANESGQNAEIKVDMIAGEAMPEINLYTPGQEEVPGIGKIAGTLTSAETGGGVADARISVEGTELAVMTDQDGSYEMELPRGEYTLNIAHPSYGNRSLEGVRVLSNFELSINMDMSLSGDGIIEEMVAVGSYIPTTATAQERDASAVLDAIGSEDFARFGDSSAASALKRVSGVTLSDGKFAVVRGLNERYTTVMLNGAQLPSPDPSRRVVPLDIFPSSVVEGISVQKSGSASTPANSAGGIVNLSTKSSPDQLEGKLSVKVTYVDTLTGQSREVQSRRGGDDWGMGAKDRELPNYVEELDFDSASNQQLLNASNALDNSNLQPVSQVISPNLGIEFAIGDLYQVTDSGQELGFNLSLKYDNSWSHEDGDKAEFRVSTGDNIVPNSESVYQRTTNDLTLSFGGGLNYYITPNHQAGYNLLVLRQSQKDTNLERKYGGDQDREEATHQQNYGEREFIINQVFGESLFERLLNTELNWNLSFSTAELDDPDRVTYSYQRDLGSTEPRVLFLSTFDRRFTEVEDDTLSINVDLKTDIFTTDDYSIVGRYGVAFSDRERDASARRFGYSWAGAGAFREESFAEDPIESILSNYLGTTAAGTLLLQENTLDTDQYEGSSELTAVYLEAEFEYFNLLKVSLGARFEDAQIDVFSAATTATTDLDASIEEDDVLPSLNATWFATENSQVRFGYYAARNRPDFRELSNAIFYDPITGDEFEGDPGAVFVAEIDNFDVRYEYYWSDAESITAGIFYKDFTNPIERTIKAKGGDKGSFFSFKSAETGYAVGLEVDARKEFIVMDDNLFISGNFAIIATEVDLGDSDPGDTGTRQMQGQPEALFNLQLGYDEIAGARQYTLVYNFQGETLYSVGLEANGVSLPDIIQEPRGQLDFNFTQDFGETLSFNASINNITNEPYELTQGDEVYRTYKSNTEYEAGFTISF